jgi:hypothetical protein
MPQFSAANFVQFYSASRPTVMTGADMLVNMSQLAAYVVPALVRGRTAADIVQPAGSGIEDVVTIPDNKSFGFYNPGDLATYPPKANSAKISHQFRLARSFMTMTDAEIKRATRGGSTTSIKNFKNMKEQERITTWANGLELCPFRKPNPDLMEPINAAANDPGLPFSLPALIHEKAASSTPSTAVVVDRVDYGVGTTWSATQATVGGINPATNSWWRNLQVSYDDTAINGDAGLIQAFDACFLRLRAWALPDAGNLMQMRDSSQLLVLTNADGVNQVKNLYRKNNDRWQDPTDPAMDFPKFDGVSLMYAPQLDTELLGLNAGKTAYGSVPYKVGRPRFFVPNRKYIKVCTDDVGGNRTVLPRDKDYPDTTFVVTDGEFQMLTNNRAAHGLIAPGSALAD